MTRLAPVGLVALAALLMLGSRPGHSDDAHVTVAKPAVLLAQADSRPAAKTTAKKAKGRLPNGYGKLGLTSQQRTKIYEIQANYNEKIEELEVQLLALRDKRDAEIVAVLTPDQKATLDKSQKDAAAKKKSAKGASAADDKTDSGS